MIPVLLDVPMPIRTARLLIAGRKAGDGKRFRDMVIENQEHLKRWMPFAQEIWSVERYETICREAEANFILRKDFQLSIYDARGETLIGSTGIHRPDWTVPSFMIGYWLDQKHLGKGYVTEALNALTRYCFEVFGAKRVYLTCDARNAKSIAVMERLGFPREALIRNECRDFEGQLRDTVIHGRTTPEGLPELEVSWG